MSDPQDRETNEAWVEYMAPFEVVIEHVGSDQSVQATEYEDDRTDNPMHPDVTVLGEPYGVASRPPKDTEYLAVATKSDLEWLICANVDRPSVSAEGAVTFFDMYASGGSWTVGNQIRLLGSDGIELEARSGKNVVTKSPTLLGSASATEAMLLGTKVKNALNTFFTAWNAAVVKWTTDVADADTIDLLKAAHATYQASLTSALTTLLTDIAGFESTKHKLDE